MNEIRGTVLVTGATGFTGSVLTRKLAEAGLDVRVIARASSRTEHLADLPITWIRGEVFDEETVQRAMAGISCVFHVAAAYREAKLTRRDYWNVHVRSTQLLAQAALDEPKFQRFVHTSTIGVHGHIERPPADENYPFHPGDEYQETKLEAELWLHDFARTHALDYTVIRPAGIYGPDDRRLLKVFKLAIKPIFPLIGRGRCLYHLIHVNDLAAAMIRVATHPKASGEVFICGNDEAIALEDMGRIIADELNRPFHPVRLPAAPFFAAAALCEGICRPLGIEPPLYKRRVAFFTKDRSFNTAKLRNVLGFHPRYSNEEGLRDTARAYVAKGWLPKPPG